VTQFHERIEDAAGGVEGLEHLLLIHPEGDHIAFLVLVLLLEASLAVFGPPDGQTSFLPQIDEAFVEIRPVERAAVSDGGAQGVGLDRDGAEGELWAASAGGSSLCGTRWG
jgi:hypothetical protein